MAALQEQAAQGEDAARRKAILARHELWTSSYRVLSVVQNDREIVVQVEVEIDLPRLQKQLLPVQDDGQAALAWGNAHIDKECTSKEMQPPAIQQALEGLGLLRADASERLSMQISCQALGAVSFTRFVAARVQARVRFGEREELLSGSGFAVAPEQAQSVAYREMLNSLVDRLDSDTSFDLRIRVLEPWPASRLRHLERVLRESVAGVQSALLLGVSPQGDAILSVKSRRSANELGQALSAVSFPGFEIEELRVQSKRSMSIRWSKGPGDQPIDFISQPADSPKPI